MSAISVGGVDEHDVQPTIVVGWCLFVVFTVQKVEKKSTPINIGFFAAWNCILHENIHTQSGLQNVFFIKIFGMGGNIQCVSDLRGSAIMGMMWLQARNDKLIEGNILYNSTTSSVTLLLCNNSASLAVIWD